MRVRTILLLVAILFASDLFATNYYFSSSSGDDSRTSTQAQNSATPWKTLNKLNSFFNSLQPGDNILLNRGDVFFGGITITKSGTSALPIKIGAFGSGAKPIITGFVTVSSWTSIGGGLYESTLASGLSTLNIVTFNGAFQAIGRWPKLSAANAGWLTSQSHSGNTSITSNAISGALNYVGGEVVIRKVHWIIDRATVTNQTSTTVTYSGASIYNPNDGNGFFFQNHNNACTALGDWCYDPSSKKIKMYFGGNNPASYTVQASVIDNLISLSAANYITFENIAVTGSNSNSFFVNNSNTTVFNGCDINYGGRNGISWNGNSSNGSVIGSTLTYINSNSITGSGYMQNLNIQNNVVSNCAMVAGMGQSGDGDGFAITGIGNNSIVQNNEVGNVGYAGIVFVGANITIQNNYIHDFCQIKDDGSAIYVNDNRIPGQYGQNRKILNNVIVNGGSTIVDFGTSDGNSANYGIYMDGSASYVAITGNSVTNCGAGIHTNSGTNLQITNNTFYNNKIGFDFAEYNISSPLSNVAMTNNIFCARTTNQLVGLCFSDLNNLNTWGTWNNNFYCRPISEPQGVIANGCYVTGCTAGIIQFGNLQIGAIKDYSLDTWRTISGQDANSSKSPKTITDLNDLRFEYNTTSSSKTISLGATYVDVKNVSYNGSITLAPYTSAVLIRTGPSSSNQSPTANAGPNQTITLPTTTASLSGSGTDPDGTITSYLWTKISGPSPSSSGAITNPTSPGTTITGLVQGVYQYQLQVTDNGGATNTATVQITVNAAGNLLPAVNPANTVNGLDYKYYEASSFSVIPNFASLTPVKTGTTNSFDITLANRADVFAFSFTGYINVPADGQYTFYANSDDGSSIYIDGVLVVNNDGQHAAQEFSGNIGLQAGKHAISVGFFEQTGDQVLTVSYSGPGVSKQVIPASALYRVSPNQSPTANAGPNQTITLPTTTASLSGSGTDPDGTITSYLWTKISGPSPSSSGAITNPTSPGTTITGLVQGVYQYQLQVTDNGGATNTATVQITVNAAGNLLPAVNPANTVNGLDYKYYEASSFSVIPNFASLTPVKTGTTNSFDITLANRADVFAFSFTGYINVPADGQYTFYANSDDGSSIYIDGVLVVNNDGQHAAQEFSGNIGLQAGKHAISVGFFEQTGDQVLTVSYSGPGVSKQVIPASALYRVSPNQSPTANAGPNQTITLPTTTASLSGSGTDPDGTITSYLWTKISGPSPSSSGAITNPTSPGTTITGLVQGVYQYQLQVTDNGGATNTATVQITVNAAGNLLPAVNPANTVNGLDYKYYEASSFSVIPNFASLTPVKTGTTNSFDITLANRADVFAFSFTGYINVPADGQYTFYANSDDGSSIYIDGVLVVNNDGQHAAQEFSGNIGLQAGKHAISVGFFEQTGDQVLTVSYSGPGVSKQVIPASALYRVSESSLVNGLNYKYYEASSFSVIPNFASLTPVKTGFTNTFDITLANRSDIFAFSFTGYISIPANGQYTFYINSDDGSNLYIDNVLVVNNDGQHAAQEFSGIISLQPGIHSISVGFFEQTGQQILTVSYSGPGIPKQVIPASVLFRDPAVTGIIRARENSTEQISTTITESKINVYPNPFTNSILINIPGEAGEYHLTMVDVTGRIVWAKSGIKPPGVFQQSINTSLFEKGIYILKVVQNNTNSVIKLLK